jgi:hypothetical protein
LSRLLSDPSGPRASVCSLKDAFLSFAVPFAVLAAFWALLIRPYYFPSRDEIALLVNSAAMFHPSVPSWFLEGYSRYFIGYPGLSQHATDFIRPVANAAYYLSSLIFGTHWAWYLLMPYAVQAGLVCLSVKLAVEAAGLPVRRALLVGLVVFLSPAFGWEQMYFASFGLDLLGALFVLAALHALWHRRFAAAWLLMLAGVFTKETTLFAPVVTALLVWLPPRGNSALGRRAGLTLLWLTPVLAWAIVRSVAFHGHAGIYVFKGGGLGAQAANILHGFLAWPFGTRTLQQSVRFRLLFFPLNGLFWVGCAAALYRLLRRSGQPAETPIPRAIPALLLYTAGALAMPVLLNLPQRFGASFFPLFFLLLATLAYAAADLSLRRAASACLAVAALAALYQKHIEPTTLRDTRAQWALASSYIEQIHASRAPYLLVVNDASGGFTSPALIARFAGYPGTLVRANNVEGLSFDHCANQPAPTLVHEPGHLQLTSSLAPACSFYAFDSVPPEALPSNKPIASYNDDELSLRASLPDPTTPPSGGTPQFFGTLTTDAHWHSVRPALLMPLFSERRYEQIP